ncbi:MAG: hypothetical protein Q9216_004963, partial [Gyalolechia sp. 2 TL-2023]
MPLNYSAAHSSRITKRTLKPPHLKRSATSPFTSFNQRKPIQRSKSKPESSTQDAEEEEEDFFGERLDDLGLVTTLATDLSLRDVAQIIQYANGHMFDPLPERGGGFNSTRIAEILNFRKSLPATVSVSHVHALSKSPTATEREVSELIKAGILLKIVIPGRGTGGSAVGEGLVLFKDLEDMLLRSDTVTDELRGKFLSYLHSHPTQSTIPLTPCTPTELSILKRAGFLTTTTTLQSSSANLHPSTPSLTSIPTISRAPSGSLAAIGGPTALTSAGATPTLRLPHNTSNPPPAPHHLSLPNMGPYLRLLTTARSHLVSLLLHKSRFRELPLYLLRERWDGGIAPHTTTNNNRGLKGGELATSMSLPARTKKWKQFCGVAFDWVLAECVGAG